MAGIYIHIPFCVQRCTYCDFYSETNVQNLNEFIHSLFKEIDVRSEFWKKYTYESIYFGGGTPSILNDVQINEIIAYLKEKFLVTNDAEITLEANPEDLSNQYLNQLSETEVNRLSIGIQSFNDKILSFMNRRHDSKQAIDCIINADKAGFKNISTDLIYGIPGLTNEEWTNNLIQMFALPIQHLSAYHLTYHDGTVLKKQLKKGIVKEVSDEKSVFQFNELNRQAKKNGFVHYEISNFSLPGFHSRHNSSYWKQIPYLGLGPSAHSYYDNMREWNVSNSSEYIRLLNERKLTRDAEKLNSNDRYNDYIITSLRTIWGVDKRKIKDDFGERYAMHFEKVENRFLKFIDVLEDNSVVRLNEEGLLISDRLLIEFMY